MESSKWANVTVALYSFHVLGILFYLFMCYAFRIKFKLNVITN